MSRSKHVAQANASPAPKNRTSLFRDDQGRLRGGWLLSLTLAAWLVATLALRVGMAAGFGWLFRVWGISASNAHRAPAWARMIYVWHGSMITLLSAVVVLALSFALRRLWRLEGRERFAPAKLGGAWLCGLGTIVSIAVLCLAPDSMRLEWPLSRPRLTAALPALCLISLVSALAEESFTKRVVFDGLRTRWGVGWAALCACLNSFFSGNGWTGGVLCAVNVLLMGLLCCAIYEEKGLWAAAGFRWGWSVATLFLLGFGGGDHAVYRLYSVSERWLTGGDGGPICGAWGTLLLVILLGCLERDRLKALWKTFRRKKATAD